MAAANKVGFTLVELSVVLVIIGLLIGGVLVGQDLFFQAGVRAQTTQLETLETQVNTSKLKYNCLPGDCATATAIFGAADPSGNVINNGNGDGIIKSSYDASGAAVGAGECIAGNVSGEVSQLFLQLYLAGFGDPSRGLLMVNPSRVGKDYPYAKFGNGTGVIVTCLSTTIAFWTTVTPLFLRQGNIIVIGISGSPSQGDGSRIGYGTGQLGIVWYTGFGYVGAPLLNPIGIPADVARRIDDKIDDGKPSKGRFGIIAGQPGCDNALASGTNSTLLAAYPSPSLACNVSAGKRID